MPAPPAAARLLVALVALTPLAACAAPATSGPRAASATAGAAASRSTSHVVAATRPRAPRGTSPAAGDPVAGSAPGAAGEGTSVRPGAAYRLPGTGALPDGAPARPRGSALVHGYPADVVPAAPGSRVSSSSVSTLGARRQVALVATSAQDGDRLLRFYRVRLGARGFTERATRAAGGSSAAAFRRGGSSVLVTVTPGHPVAYSVLATLARAPA